MNWIQSFMSNRILFYGFLGILAIVAIVLTTLIYMERKNIKEFEDEAEFFDDDDKIEEVEEIKEEASEEVKITQIGVEETETEKTNLEEVLEKMQADLDKKEDVVALFEQEQEEKAIISYQELLNSKNKNNTGANKELLSVIEKIESGSSAKEIVEEYNNEEEVEEKQEKKFKTTDFISPVYGKVDNHIEYPTIPNYEKMETRRTRTRHNIEVDKKVDIFEENNDHNDAFLNALKEFRSNLE